jgi:hypothetical protein
MVSDSTGEICPMLARSLQAQRYMNVIKVNTRAPKTASARPALEIRFHLADGSKETFVQTDAKIAELTRQRINLCSLFDQPRIIVADDYSKSVFVCSQINRLDLIFDDAGFSRIPPDHADLVELTEAEFNTHVPLDEPTLLERRVQQRHVGDLLVSFLHVRMRGGCHIYLMNEAIIKLPIENHSFVQRMLSKGVYGIRLRERGQGFLNLQNLVGYTVYPGVAEVPADTLIAQPIAHL